ncbi:hypothetical protein [Acetobacter malorum]|nr:hypothetical protein [Acetobacter malorum]
MTERYTPTGAQLVRFVPYIYLRSDKADRNVKLRLSIGLNTDDVNQLLEKLPQPFSDTATQALQFYRRSYLLDLADDWRYMTEVEISRFLAADVARENGVAEPPDDEVPPLDEDEFATSEGDGHESSGA